MKGIWLDEFGSGGPSPKKPARKKVFLYIKEAVNARPLKKKFGDPRQKGEGVREIKRTSGGSRLEKE